MKTNHPAALSHFQRRIATLLVLRTTVLWMTLWFCLWGVVVMAARFSGVTGAAWLVYGIGGFIPLVVIASWRVLRQRPAFEKVRAAYDNSNACGGVVMSEEVADMSAWQSRLSPAAVPALHWKSGRTMSLFGLASAFLAVALLLPERYTRLTSHRPLEIGQIVQELKAEVETLQEEEIVEEQKAKDLKQELSKLEENASGLDPNKTWEALDHIKESNSEAAKRAAEEALNKLSELSAAETLTAALSLAAELGIPADTATQAAQDLASMLSSTKLEEGLLKVSIPPELLADLDVLNKEEMERLLNSLQLNKSSLSNSVSRLAALKMIDPAKLAQCNKAGQCKNPNALAAYLSSCTNACNSYCELALGYCRGGLNRGRGDAPMTWSDGTSEEDAKFKEEALPQATQLSDAQLVGVSRTAPELSGEDVTITSGALASAEGSGGSAHSQVVLPRHRQAVQRFFKRDE